MLSLSLMCETARRCDFKPSRALLDDSGLQAKYCLDAPSEVQDGCEWYEDDEADLCGPVPRVVALRDLTNPA